MQERTFTLATHPTVSDPPPLGRLVVTSPDDPRCAVREVLNRVADKWTALVITILGEGRLGYAELRRSTAGISDKMLAQTLRKLEGDGLVSRTVHPSTPVRVTYQLTALGETLVPPLQALRRWAVEYGPQLLAHRSAHQQRGTAGPHPPAGQHRPTPDHLGGRAR